jgi:hypothetical protein
MRFLLEVKFNNDIQTIYNIFSKPSLVTLLNNYQIVNHPRYLIKVPIINIYHQEDHQF